MNRRIFFFGSLASLYTTGCGSGSKPGVFQQIDEFTLNVNEPDVFDGIRFVLKDGAISWRSSEAVGSSFLDFVNETANFGKELTKRREISSFYPEIYDRINDRYVTNDRNRIQIGDRDLNLISDIPIVLPEGISDIVSRPILDGDGILAFTTFPNPGSSGSD